jgi:hypothetical protein
MTAPLPQEPVIQSLPSDPRIRALCRPSNYGDLPPRQQWEIDRELNILDWDGVV